jgi:peptidoglycan/xylan/chitin deacetylase (PgdA/CDA1 family)
MKPPEEVLAAWTLELDAARRYGCLLMLTMHPDCTGRPSRLAALRRLIETALTRGDVEVVTALEAATRAHADPGLACRALSDLDPHPDAAVYPHE